MANQTPTITTSTITNDGKEPRITIAWTETTWGRCTYYGNEAIAIAAKIVDGATVDDALLETIEQNRTVHYWPNEMGDFESETEYWVGSSNMID